MTSSLAVLLRGAAIAAWVLAATAARAGEIALTFDDVPGQDGRRFTGAQRTERLIEELHEAGVRSQAPATLLDDRRRVAALAVREPAKAPVGRPVFEDTSWLEAQFERVVARD